MLFTSLRHTSLTRNRNYRRRVVAPCALFTGIVQGRAEVTGWVEKPGAGRLQLRFPSGATRGVVVGASIAVAGVCLTVVEQPSADELCFDVIAETLRATSLSRALRVGAAVNFERSARIGDEVGGHAVSGHVHAAAVVRAVEDTPGNRQLVLSLPNGLIKYVFPKGYVAVDGCSLTVGPVVGSSEFSVYLIPETLRVTTLGSLVAGSVANVELEAATIATVETVERVIERYKNESTA